MHPRIGDRQISALLRSSMAMIGTATSVCELGVCVSFHFARHVSLSRWRCGEKRGKRDQRLAADNIETLKGGTLLRQSNGFQRGCKCFTLETSAKRLSCKRIRGDDD
jgi:hypothetical protein